MLAQQTQRSTRRLVVLVALLLGEGLFLGVCFDADALGFLPAGWWRTMLGAMPLAPQVGFAIAAAGLMISGPRLRETLAAGVGAQEEGFHNGPFVVAQLLAFLGVVLVTAALFGVVLPRTHHPGSLALVWLAMSAAALAFWLAALVPPRTLAAIVRHAGGALAAGVLVGWLAWVAGRYTQAWWTPLRRSTLAGAAALLRLVDASVRVDYPHYLIGARHFTIEISPDCSGYEGIGLVWVFLASYFWAFRRQLRFPQALLIFPAATVAVWVTNVVRIAALVMVGAGVSPAIAKGGFHSFSGALLFSGVALAAAAVAYRLPYFSRVTVETERPANVPVEDSAAPWIAPLIAMIATGLVTGLLYPSGLDPLYALRVIATIVVLWHFRRAYRGLDWGFSTAAIAAGGLVFLVWIVLAVPGGPASTPFPLRSAAGIRWLFWRGVGSVAIAPIVEELAFRGYLARRTMAVDFASVPMRLLSWPAIATSALLFGALHAQFLAGCFAGVAYGWIVRRRGQLTDAIVAHAATNALLVAYVLTTRSWWLLG